MGQEGTCWTYVKGLNDGQVLIRVVYDHGTRGRVKSACLHTVVFMGQDNPALRTDFIDYMGKMDKNINNEQKSITTRQSMNPV